MIFVHLTEKCIDAFQDCANYFQLNSKRYCKKDLNNTTKFTVKETSVRLGVKVSNSSFQPHFKLRLKLIAIKHSSTPEEPLPIIIPIILVFAVMTLSCLATCLKLTCRHLGKLQLSSNDQPAQIIQSGSTVSTVPVRPFNIQPYTLPSTSLFFASGDTYHFQASGRSYNDQLNYHFNSTSVTIDRATMNITSEERSPEISLDMPPFHDQDTATIENLIDPPTHERSRPTAEVTLDLPPNYDQAIIESLNELPSYESV